jgi:hypothetical protein
MASVSPTTTIGAANVGPWNCVPAHYNNTAGARAYVASATALSDGTLEFVTMQGLLCEVWYFNDSVNDGDVWDRAFVSQKSPAGIVCAAWIPRDDDEASNLKAVRVTYSAANGTGILFTGTGASGSGWVVLWRRA